jgi:AraC-like DNA-binding protein
MQVVVRPPLLAPYVSSIGYLEGRFAHARERALPTGTMQLLVNLDSDRFHSYAADGSALSVPGVALQGASSRPTVIDPADQRAVLWVAFRPGGAYPFFRVPAVKTTDQLVALDELWGREGVVLRERLLDASTPREKLRLVAAALLAHATLEPDPAVTAAVGALRRGASVSGVSDALGWTPRLLYRRFGDHIGLAPKRFARLQRFQRLVASVARGPQPIDWARRAAEHGYHDQSHLIHEFRDFAGLSPSQYTPRSPADRNHVPIPTIPAPSDRGRMGS